MNPRGQVLFLWRNSETVVIGRYQNPWSECNLEKMKAEGVKLARRQSGGGAVFHDKENLNFTFLSGIDDYDKDKNFQIIKDALKSFGIDADVSGRNDMTVEGKKISGSAFRLTKDRAFHHGTLLVNVDLGRLKNYLNPDPLKLESKGIKSVRSRVANLKEFNPALTVEALGKAITRAFFEHRGSGTEEVMNLDSLKEIPPLVSHYETLRSDAWLYGKSPDFTHRLQKRFSWGGVDIHFNVKQAVLEDVMIYTDCLYPEMIRLLQKGLKGQPYNKNVLRQVNASLETVNPDWAPCLKDIHSLLERKIP